MVFKATALGDGTLGLPNILVPSTDSFLQMRPEQQEAAMAEVIFLCGGLYKQLVDDYPNLNEKVLNYLGGY